MGQEERRNKAKLEKTQISVVTSNAEYENAVRALEETTTRWNREWKAAADKFQDLEEERLDFTKNSLWTFANIASTVCVSDDASCENIRLSLEKMDVEKDITTFIQERGTGQEIPDAPKYINFCRGDVNDSQSEMSEDDNYSVAQFPRHINPAFRTSSPQPSTFESHHDPNSALAHDLAGRDQPIHCRQADLTPQQLHPQVSAHPQTNQYQYQGQLQGGQMAYDANQHGQLAAVPHDPYPKDGMTMLCRTGPPGPPSDMSSQVTSARPSSKDSHSDYATSFSSQEPPSGKVSPAKQDVAPTAVTPEKKVLKKKSGFFQNHSPFRRKSTKDISAPGQHRNTWHAANQNNDSPGRRPQFHNQDAAGHGNSKAGRAASPEPIDANASLALGVGQNVLPVFDPARESRAPQQTPQSADEGDPIAMALAELKGVTMNKQSSVRQSADNYHGLATPAPGNRDVMAASRGTPPPSYQQTGPASRLGVPPPAVTSRAMKEATKKATEQARTIFGDGSRGDPSGYRPSPKSRAGTRSSETPRATSPAPARSASPQPMRGDPRMNYRSASPNPSGDRQYRNSSQTSMGRPRGSDQGYYRGSSPNEPSPASYRDYGRSKTSYGSVGSAGDMSVQLARAGDDGYGSVRGHGQDDSGAMGLYDGGQRQRSKSLADAPRQYSRDGRPILHFGKWLGGELSRQAEPWLTTDTTARALYMYQAAIPEELGFSKGDYLAVFRHQDDGWWEAEVHGGDGHVGLVPSNYLQPC